ncbi:MAG TPA: hypothetical protein VLC95_04035 [Anaerolineae bacterium]|jgi:hypothetical protein|nr:hypothetical protein [Anaerolineae bacterium]
MDDRRVGIYDDGTAEDPDEGAYAETYEETYEEPYYHPQPPARRGMSPWLIALIVVLALILVCCVCLCLGILLLGPAVGTTFSTIIETIEVMTPVP